MRRSAAVGIASLVAASGLGPSSADVVGVGADGGCARSAASSCSMPATGAG